MAKFFNDRYKPFWWNLCVWAWAADNAMWWMHCSIHDRPQTKWNNATISHCLYKVQFALKWSLLSTPLMNLLNSHQDSEHGRCVFFQFPASGSLNPQNWVFSVTAFNWIAFGSFHTVATILWPLDSLPLADSFGAIWWDQFLLFCVWPQPRRPVSSAHVAGATDASTLWQQGQCQLDAVVKLINRQCGSSQTDLLIEFHNTVGRPNFFSVSSGSQGNLTRRHFCHLWKWRPWSPSLLVCWQPQLVVLSLSIE